MPGFYLKSSPALFKDSDNDVVVHHNHCQYIDYRSFDYVNDGNVEREQLIDRQKVLLSGCIKFFKTFADDNGTDIALRAAAKAAITEDKERLKDFESHKKSRCVIL